MKTKYLVIMQVIFLVIGILLTLIGQYVGTNDSFWVMSLILANLCYGIGIGIGIGSTNEKEQ